ncbi:ATP-dependent RNA helicase [Kribbella sp.]|uniref:ATP-dependent RNA helicase n=1 Tax=Kribbella sp. TaxID=1871183 RepID=UPI002D6A8F29|nr:ATP-dependent helicase C-terminal domain-containing protein [Kribbella sp.]HZX07757.1 ATP-dependent helicase C-terminal domain-containing protein [Kribbella sp.]
MLLPESSVPGADLPVRAVLPAVVDAVRSRGTAVLVAPPGSGKTSLLPLALGDALGGTIVVAEPRRLATRAAAARLAMLVGEPLGQRIGYAMRGERSGGKGLRVEVVTTGLLVRRLQQNPELPGVSAIVIDECHERHLDADLLLAFCVDVRENLREDLAIVATSATADTVGLSRVLGTARVVTASAAMFDVAVEWTPPPVAVPLLPGGRVDPRLLDHVAAVVRRALADDEGDILVFVPGEAEINGVSRRLAGENVLPLFGRQSRAEQARALAPGSSRRIVVTTSVAESSLTVPGVRVVVDSGLAREPRTDQSRGLGSLVTCRVSRSSADQRAGRAGREAPGRVYRCWSATDHSHLDDHPAPEIAIADLASFALDLAAWGAPAGDGLTLLDAPPVVAMNAATELLRRLDAVDNDGRITERGRRMAAIGAHPRLARALLDGTPRVGAERAGEIVAMLSDDSARDLGDDLPARWQALRRSENRTATARWREETKRLTRGTSDPSAAAGVRPTANGQVGRSREAAPGPAPRTAGTHGVPGEGVVGRGVPDDLAVGVVVGLAYPERVGRIRGAGSATYQMSGGTGAVLDAESSLRSTAWLAIAVADRAPGRADARIRSAAPIDERTARDVAGDLVTTTDQIRWDDGRVVTRRVEALGAIVLNDVPLTNPDPLLVQAAVRDGIRRSGLSVLRWSQAALSLRERLAFCHAHLGAPWPAVDDEALLAHVDEWLGTELATVRRSSDLARIDVTSALRRLLPWPAATRFGELAPERLKVPSGSEVRLTYDGAEPPVLAVKLQEVFGWTATPVVADGRVPVVLHLLSPARRPVAITSDLASFWKQGYPQVRADLRGRYPRHPWPEDPFEVTKWDRIGRVGRGPGEGR